MENKTKITLKGIFENQFVRYIIIGGINTVVSMIVFNLLLILVRNDSTEMRAIMMVPAQFTGILVSYLLNSIFNFKRKLSIQGFIAFGGPLAILQIVFGLGGMYVLSNLGMDRNVAFVIITAINVVLGYTITKFLLNKFTEEA